MADLIVSVNTGASDVAYGTSGYSGYINFQEGSDKLIFTAGSDEVGDAENIPTEAELLSAGIRLTDPLSQIIVSSYILQDTSANLLYSIDNMGNVDKRYVLAFDFDAATASEPTLEAWDDSGLDTITSTFLGAGTPSNSFLRGITTTSASSGSGWATTTGIRMAGSGSGNFLYLNSENGPLTGADTLYANLAVVIPSSNSATFSLTPVLCVKWLDS